jgi:phosphohistidine phosphatase
MKVYFLRHGIADPENWNGPDDLRPLTGEGIKRMSLEAKALAKMDLGVEAVVTSPLVRAKQTAEIVSRKLGVDVSEDGRLAFGFNARLCADIVRERSEARAIMLVGHEPSMSATIGDITGGSRLDFKKGSVACVEIGDPDSPHGTLLWFVPPRVLLA